MPYEVRGKCIYKKDGGAKVGCTKGSVKKYLAALHANADESVESNKQSIDEMKGGLADNKTAKDIADKFDVSISKINHQIEIGIKFELKHTDSRSIAKEIAMDHLVDIPDYYTRLTAMEKKAHKKFTNENTKQLIKRLLHENVGLFLTDETPEATTFHILDHQDKVGTVIVGQPNKGFGKNTLEILVIFFDKGTIHLELGQQTIEALFKKFPDINRIVLQPKPNSVDFWSKLQAQRMSDKYMIIFRGH